MTNPALRLVGFLAVLFLVVGAAVALDTDDPGGSRAIPGGQRPRPVELGEVRLVSSESCEELVAFYRDAAALSMSGVAVDSAMGGAEESMAMDDTGSAAAPGAAPSTTVGAERQAAADGADADEHSGTNLQERDVDEPDTVKTDGDVAVVTSYNGLNIVDVGDGEPALLSTVELEPGGREILLAGDRVLVLSTVYRESQATVPSSGGAERMVMPVGKEVTVLTAVDISDPANPEITDTHELEGGYRTARATGDTARIVLVSYPQMLDSSPEAIETMTVEDWAPDGVACDSVAHPTEPQGVSTTTVVTVDLTGDLEPIDADAVVADPGTVYASSDRLYIATSQWSSSWATPDGPARTELHAFDISDPAATGYVGSGAVDGFLLNQFALSEHEGDLRVATTLQPPWNAGPAGAQPATSSSVVVLAEEGDGLAEIGRVDGLGETEVIRSVRFMGDVAYVVTFRQTDPLYVIDLSDPRAPRTAGELKIPGYSAYLHPIDEDRMIGVGQDADEEGTVLGTQVSTFDVSDMTAPTRIDQTMIERGSSTVEWDHRAFLWWAATRTAVIPVEVFDPQSTGVTVDCPPDADCAMPAPAPEHGFIGAVAFAIGEDGGVAEAGRVTHAGRSTSGAWHAIQRSFVVGDSLYTVSELGVLKSALTGFGDEGFAALPAPQYDAAPMPMPIEDGPGGGAAGTDARG